MEAQLDKSEDLVIKICKELEGYNFVQIKVILKSVEEITARSCKMKTDGLEDLIKRFPPR